ncbi:uncharacterized protein RJT21DRAFT_139168 [Scheffersomyces amazonensis]|uniref:uncharacterized protein n=1 Tax=Scheffersomyces amazonensis TaxID=1078765 RepID=UPI00315DE4EE
MDSTRSTMSNPEVIDLSDEEFYETNIVPTTVIEIDSDDEPPVSISSQVRRSRIVSGTGTDTIKSTMPSSPIARAPENDSIVDSTFSFPSQPKNTYNAHNTSILDVHHWISSDSDSDGGFGDHTDNQPVLAKRSSTFPVTSQSNIPKPKPKPSSINYDEVIEVSSYLSSSQPNMVNRISSQTEVPPTTAGSNLTPIKSPELFVPSSIEVQCSTPSRKSKAIPIRPDPKPQTTTKPKGDDREYKAALAKANRVTRTKDELLSEMTIYLSKNHFRHFNKDEFESILAPTNLVFYEDDDLPLIYWKRLVSAKYDKAQDIFIPCQTTYITEKNIVIYYTAENFFDKIQNNLLKNDISRVKRKNLPSNNEIPVITIVIEGLELFINKIKQKENRKYKEAVIQRMNPNDDNQQKSKKRKSDEVEDINLSSKEIEFILQKTEFEYNVVLFPVRNAKEAMIWLQSFTYTIAYALYDKFERNSSLSNIGTIRSGKDIKSTFLQTIQQFKLMTESKAERLYMFYPNVQALHKRLIEHGTLGQDESGRNIVPPSSDIAMRKFFTATDPHSAINES